MLAHVYTELEAVCKSGISFFGVCVLAVNAYAYIYMYTCVYVLLHKSSFFLCAIFSSSSGY